MYSNKQLQEVLKDIKQEVDINSELSYKINKVIELRRILNALKDKSNEISMHLEVHKNSDKRAFYSHGPRDYGCTTVFNISSKDNLEVMLAAIAASLEILEAELGVQIPSYKARR